LISLGSQIRCCFRVLILLVFGCLESCGLQVWNNPYPTADASAVILYTSFSERPKHLDPAVAYNANEYSFIGQIYEPPLQYHYLIQPYTLIPLTVSTMPILSYLNSKGELLADNAEDSEVAFSEYELRIRPGIRYQPHPAFSKNEKGQLLYHALDNESLSRIHLISDFEVSASREMTAYDYVYQIKRLVDPRIHSPIAELMKHYIVGLSELSEELKQFSGGENNASLDLRNFTLSGVEAVDRYRFRIRIRGKYPQFKFWLAMPFFAPMPWEAVEFYSQPGLIEKNITLDWYPVGTGPYRLIENNPNKRMVLARNPNFHEEYYPSEGEADDRAQGLLDDADKKIPFIDKVVFSLEKESIPYWNKFLQGYYDKSGISSDSFDQSIQFSGQGSAELTETLNRKNIYLQTSVTTSISYMGFNMLDTVVGGYDQRSRLLRRAISIAFDYEEYISIFMNGRGVAAQGMLPPGIFGYADGKKGINPYIYDWDDGEVRRKDISQAKQILASAGYPGGNDSITGKPLVLYLDTVATGPDSKARLNWYRKQFAKINIQLVIRATDYNRFQQKMRSGNAQMFMWGWNADYPDPENFFFLLHGPNAMVKFDGENAVNYRNPEFDRLFESMRSMQNGAQRYEAIQQLQELVRRDSPWLFGFHPKKFSLYHSWNKNQKPNLMANNSLKYIRIDAEQRKIVRQNWNQPKVWPLGVFMLAGFVCLIPAWMQYRKKQQRLAA